MDNSAEFQESTRSQKLKAIMSRIETSCNPEDGNGVVFKKDAPQTEEEKKKTEAVNAIYDGMMMTLSSIGEYALEQASDVERPKSKSYENVLRSLVPLAEVTRALADDQLPLKRDTEFEQEYAEVGDKVSQYYANNFQLGNLFYDDVRVLIRPKKWEAVAGSPKRFENRPNPVVRETAQSRIMAIIRPKNYPLGQIIIRVDREDLEHDFDITYDIEIGSQGQNLLDKLEFPQTTLNRGGHHFSSSIKAEDFGVTFSEILETMDSKIAAKAERS